MRTALFRPVVVRKLRTSVAVAMFYWIVSALLSAYAFGAGQRLPPLGLLAAAIVASGVVGHVVAWGLVRLAHPVQTTRGERFDWPGYVGYPGREGVDTFGVEGAGSAPIRSFIGCRAEATGETRFFLVFPFGPVVFPALFFVAFAVQGFLVLRVGSSPATPIAGWSAALPLSAELLLLTMALATIGAVAGCYAAGSGVSFLNQIEITPRRVVLHSLTRSRVFRAGRDAVCLRSPTARSPLVWVVLSSRHGPAVSMCVSRACAEHMRAVWSGRPRRSRGAGRDYGTADTLPPCSARSNER